MRLANFTFEISFTNPVAVTPRCVSDINLMVHRYLYFPRLVEVITHVSMLL